MKRLLAIMLFAALAFGGCDSYDERNGLGQPNLESCDKTCMESYRWHAEEPSAGANLRDCIDVCGNIYGRLGAQ